MKSNKPQGWYVYQTETFAVVDPQDLKVVCAVCKSSHTTSLEHEITGEKGWGCLRCGHITPDSEKQIVLDIKREKSN